MLSILQCRQDTTLTLNAVHSAIARELRHVMQHHKWVTVLLLTMPWSQYNVSIDCTCFIQTLRCILVLKECSLQSLCKVTVLAQQICLPPAKSSLSTVLLMAVILQLTPVLSRRWDCQTNHYAFNTSIKPCQPAIEDWASSTWCHSASTVHTWLWLCKP